MKKIVVIGADGLLGSKIINTHLKNYEIVGTYHKNKPVFEKTFQLDITNKKQVESLKKLNPDIIIHTASLTNVDYCEDNREEAWDVNVKGTENILEVSEKIRNKIIFLSTDYIFDGKNGPYSEGEELNPINYYGKTKLECEKLVKSSRLEYIIVRTTVLYGWGKNRLNFVTWVIDELKNGRKIKVVRDQYGTPTLADNLAEVILELILHDKRGIYNVAGSSLVNRYEFALKIADIFELNKGLITPVTSEELNQRAPRPKRGGLKIDKIKKEMRVKLLTIEEGLFEMKKQARIEC